MPEHESIWPPGTERGEHDRDHDRIVCADCDWYDTGGPTACAWTYHDHRLAAHPERPTDDSPVATTTTPARDAHQHARITP